MTALTRQRTRLALVAIMVTSAATVRAQDSAQAEIQTRLRAFYFNLAHRDWEALTADILPAKVVAHRPAPEALVRAAGTRLPAGSGDHPAGCTSAPAVERAAITLAGDWAEVSVPRCSPAEADEFRLIRFEVRWRFVYIALFQEPGSLSSN